MRYRFIFALVAAACSFALSPAQAKIRLAQVSTIVGNYAVGAILAVRSVIDRVGMNGILAGTWPNRGASGMLTPGAALGYWDSERIFSGISETSEKRS
jgi:hypothetical protein